MVSKKTEKQLHKGIGGWFLVLYIVYIACILLQICYYIYIGLKVINPPKLVAIKI